MSAIDDLISKIADTQLRNRIREELDRQAKQHKFGLVFENHLPECTFLYEYKVEPGSIVAWKSGSTNTLYQVLKIVDDNAVCLRRYTNEIANFPIKDLVVAAEFGDPIYPYLKMLDSICKAPDSNVWHILIESDNYHALQLLDYLYHGKVDCIYIDPPYNTGARDWKYNNDYVDSNDAYRHSKWLSMMEKRLKLAKRLLNPDSSVMIITIDEKEYNHLGCLLEQLFPDAKIQMVSSAVNPKGSVRDGFSRSDEYIYFVMFGDSFPARLPLSKEWSASATVSEHEESEDSNAGKNREPGWTSMMRRGTDSLRSDTPGLYYPIYVDPESRRIMEIGNTIPQGQDRADDIPNLVQVLPYRRNGEQGRWQVSANELKNRIKQGRVRLGRPTDYGFVINYLPDGEYAKIKSGEFDIQGYADDGSLIAYRNAESANESRVPPSHWKIASHNASENGTSLLNSFIGEKRFAYPKSLYAVYDTLRFFVHHKPEALIVDFFAGSGTTLHAVNLLNYEDGGSRRCIMVTNNEVSADEAKDLANMGYQQADEEWEKFGIARYVTWPRTVCSINGRDIKNQVILGDYGVEKEYFEPDDEVSVLSKTTGKPTKKTVYRKIRKQLYPQLASLSKSVGFKANAYFFKLGFLDRTAISLGEEFRNLIPLLWLKSGGIGACPEVDSDDADKSFYIFTENRFAILPDERNFRAFQTAIALHPEIRLAYLITDSESSFQAMAKQLPNMETIQLYRDYLDNFSINRGGKR